MLLFCMPQSSLEIVIVVNMMYDSEWVILPTINEMNHSRKRKNHIRIILNHQQYHPLRILLKLFIKSINNLHHNIRGF